MYKRQAQEGVDLVKSYQSQGILVTLVGGIIDQCEELGYKTGANVRVIPPVSYTHLDVYKRQESGGDIMCLATAYKEKEEPNSILLEYVARIDVDGTTPVSYTHLLQELPMREERALSLQ